MSVIEPICASRPFVANIKDIDEEVVGKSALLLSQYTGILTIVIGTDDAKATEENN